MCDVLPRNVACHAKRPGKLGHVAGAKPGGGKEASRWHKKWAKNARMINRRNTMRRCDQGCERAR
eukprot:15482480-Alexandrium_andersonii.AAC.1